MRQTVLLSLICLGAATPACAQGPSFVFQYLASQGGPVTVTSGGVIQFPATPLGQSSNITLVSQNQGNQAWTLTQVQAAGAFSAKPPSDNSIAAGSAVSIPLTFTPSVSGAVNGTLNLTLAAAGQAVNYVFFLMGTGTAPVLAMSYILNPAGNQTAITDGQTLPFPATNIGSSSAATFSVTNQGTGQGTLDSVAVSGAGFSVSGLPLLPATVNPQGAVSFTVTFQPGVAGATSGTLSVILGGSTKQIQLSGSTFSAALSYAFTYSGGTQSLTPGQSLTVPSTTVGQSTTIGVSVQNSGSAPVQIGALTLTGAAFQLVNAPPSPVTLNSQQSVSFSIQFSPTDAAVYTAVLNLGSAVFNLTGTGLGPKFQMSVQLSGVTTTVAANGAINFPNTSVGAQMAGRVVVANTGNQPLTISNIAVAGSTFNGSGFPQLPAIIQPGGSINFSITFAPNTVGVLTGTLQISGQSFSIIGSGSTPPDIPAVQFGDVSGQASALAQPFISLHLGAVYPYDLSGTLTIAFSSNSFVDDPAIQFATGGRTVAFSIPANSTDAIFGSSGKKIQFQTGTVNGAITFTPSFQVAGLTVTPAGVTSQTVSIAAVAPQIQGVRTGTISGSSVEILVTGYATTRAISNMQMQLAAAPGGNLQSQSLSVDAAAAFNTWYQSAASAQYGSQFTVSIMLLVNGSLSDIQSITVTASNSQGVSQPVTVNLR